MTKPEDMYTQQDPLFLDTSGSAGKAIGIVIGVQA